MDFSHIDLLIYDCDGVLTDNRVIVSETGEESAVFNRGDGTGIRLLREAGIRQVIISTEVNPIVEHRARKLNIDVLHTVKDKRQAVQEYCGQNGISLQETMFIGNDVNDLEAMKAVGACGCPKDAEPEVLAVSGWISEKNGGAGVIRELCREILNGRGSAGK